MRDKRVDHRIVADFVMDMLNHRPYRWIEGQHNTDGSFQLVEVRQLELDLGEDV